MSSPTLFDGKAKWTGETGTGDAVAMSAWPNKTVGHNGTGTIAVQGSMDGTNWVVLHDSGGTEISTLASGDLAVILENPIFIRPVVTSGTTTVVIVGSA